ncbi:hypothetical protein PMAYCL1PPCAC_04370, partial [Pristionchus mayeri]
SEFSTDYDKLYSLLDELKPLFETIDLETTRLPQISNQNDIMSLSSHMVITIGDAEEIITKYTGIVEAILARIDEMGKTIEHKERAEKEEKNLEDVTTGVHGSSNLAMNAVSLTSLLKSKESKYENTLNRSIRRVRAVSMPNQNAFTVQSPSPPQVTQSQPASVDQGGNSSGINNPQLITALSPPAFDTRVSSLTHGSTPSACISSSTSSLSLPPIRLETFDGSDITRWSAFKYQIESLIINQPHLSEVEKIFHIRSNLKGEAHSLIASLPVQRSFLTKILTRLESEYDRSDLTQARLMQSLRSIRAKSSRIDDQLSAVRAMINIAHSIHGESGINALCMQQQLAESIHPKFITLVTRKKPDSLVSALELIEDKLREEREDSVMISAFTSQRSNSVVNSQYNNGSLPSKAHASTAPHTKSPASHSSSTPNHSRKIPLCVFCGTHQYSGECARVTSIREKKEILKNKSLCFSCFSPNHSSDACYKSCPQCKAKHHKSLCTKQSSPNQSGIHSLTTSPRIQLNTRLFTAPVMLANTIELRSSYANALLDAGAQVSLISRRLVNQLHLKPIDQLHASITGVMTADQNSLPSSHEVVQFELITDHGREVIKAIVHDTDTITQSIHHQPLSEADLDVIRTTLTTIPVHFTQSTVIPDLLLGVGDTFKLLENSTSTTLPGGYRLIQSVIGPLVAGSENLTPPLPTKKNKAAPTNQSQGLPPTNPSDHQVTPSLTVASVTTVNYSVDQLAERFLSVDPISRVYETTEKEERKLADELVTKHFNDTVQSHDDGYYVQYAMKPDAKDELPDNYNLAVSRLSSTQRNLSTDRNLLLFYDSVIQDQISLGQVEAVDPSDTNQLVSNLYVDNIIITADNPSSFMYTQSKHLFQSMSMNLRDYSSNSSSFMSCVPDSDQSKDSNQKLLGLIWNTEEDSLSINIPVSNKREKESKRSMLSTVSSSYDPLGLLNPLLLPPRLTVQGLWNSPIKWDEPVDESTRESFHNQISDLEQFSLPIYRFTHISESNDITLVAFCDASKSAMAASVYSYVPGQKPTLIISKTRLAPINSKSTIPKMELDSLAMAHNLLQFTVETIRKEFPTKQIHVYSFSDSAVTLHWCRPGFNKPVGVFVSNRVKLIHSIRDALTSDNLLSYHSPRHVRGEENPADHATRGLS